VFEKIKTASPKAIPAIFTHKLFRRANSFYELCSAATEKFNDETNKIVFERTFEFSKNRTALSYILLYIFEIGVDKTNDYASIYYISEFPGCQKQECIIHGKRMKFEFEISLSSVYAVLKNVPCVYYRRDQKYMWK
jgi:hypothetical protein